MRIRLLPPRPLPKPRHGPALTPDEVIAIAARHFGADVSELRAHRRDLDRTDEARLLTYGLLEAAGYYPFEIARAMGRHPSTISTRLRRVPGLLLRWRGEWDAARREIVALTKRERTA